MSSLKKLTKSGIQQVVQNRQVRASQLESSLTWVVKPILDQLSLVSSAWEVTKHHNDQVTLIIDAVLKALPGMEGYVTVMWDQEMQVQAVHRLDLLVSASVDAIRHEHDLTHNWMVNMASLIGLYIALGEVPGLSLVSQLRPDLPCLHYTT